MGEGGTRPPTAAPGSAFGNSSCLLYFWIVSSFLRGKCAILTFTFRVLFPIHDYHQMPSDLKKMVVISKFYVANVGFFLDKIIPKDASLQTSCLHHGDMYDQSAIQLFWINFGIILFVGPIYLDYQIFIWFVGYFWYFSLEMNFLLKWNLFLRIWTKTIL